MPPNVATEASLTTRVTSWFASLPFATLVILGLCLIVYVICLLVGFDDYHLICMSPYRVINDYQAWRAFSSTIFHGGILHIAFNMMTYAPLGAGLERLLGTIRYTHAILLFAVTNAVLHTIAAAVAAYNPAYPYPMALYECSIGFSGVLFALIVVETHMSGVQSRSIFGMFSVPAKWYPWALLVVFQLLMPSVSLLGHLSGLLSGVAYIYGWFNWLLLSSSICGAIESSSLLGPLVRRPNCIAGGSVGAGTLPTAGESSNAGGGLSSMWRSLQGWSPLPSGPQNESSSQFPGRGRTLGGSSAPPEPPRPLRGLSSAGGAVRPPQRSPPSNGLKGRPEPLVGVGRNRSMPIQPRQEIDRRPSQVQAEGDKDALARLLEMGFPLDAAKAALISSGGDVNAAVELLGSSGRS